MTISHEPHTAESETCFVFAQLGDLTVSVCAPMDWLRERVEAFANERFPRPGDPFVSVDVSKLLGVRSSTPSVCNQAPRQRTHWMLFRRSLADQDFDKQTPDFKNIVKVKGL